MTIEQFERINALKKDKTWNEQKEEEMMSYFLESAKRCLDSRLKEEIKMKDLATVDRIEGEYAVCELLNGDMVDIPLKQFKEIPLEGDIFNLEIISRDGVINYSIQDKNIEEMENRRRKILEKINRLKNR